MKYVRHCILLGWVCVLFLVPDARGGEPPRIVQPKGVSAQPGPKLVSPKTAGSKQPSKKAPANGAPMVAAPKAAPKGPAKIVQPAPPSDVLRKRALAGPLRDHPEIVFAVRAKYNDGHWYANIGYYCDDESLKAYAGNGAGDVGKLCKLNLRTGDVSVLLDAKTGSIRDPQVHYDGKKILFAWRKEGTDYYNLYEINTDGSGLRQITSGPYDDFEPTYLPDGDILFVSTRCNRWVNCWKTQVAIMFRCGPNGENIHAVSANTEHDNTPWMLPDGRVLYTRWEYVDRSQVEFHHLWVMNPDGTNHMVFYGNMHPKIVMIDAKPIPGTNKVVASFSPGHGINEHAGIVTIVSPDKGPDDLTAAQPLHKNRFRDPYALSEDLFLVAMNNQILLLDSQGTLEPIYTHKGDEGQLHEPRPIQPRPREPILPRRANPAKPVGHYVLSDIYNSRNLAGVHRGEIKKLLVLETLPKQVNFSGGPDLLSWLGTFSLERVLGTVPVEPDGSAYFEVPPGRQLFFVALDEKDLSVKRMHSFTSLMPGEVMSCVGCHEERQKTPEQRGVNVLQALQRPPSRIQPFEGFPDVIDFSRDIQPILDAHCVRCHDYSRREGKVVLAGDLGPHWSHSYYNLLAFRLVADGRNGLGNYPPRTIGSSASRLLKLVDGSHYGAKVSEREWRMLWLWIESGATYAGSYAALRNEDEMAMAGRAYGQAWGGCNGVLRRRCAQCHAIGGPAEADKLPLPYSPERLSQRPGITWPVAVHERVVFENDPIARFGSHILFNFTRPEYSPIVLGPLAKEAGGYGSCGEVFQDKNDPDYKTMVDAIARGKAVWNGYARYGSPDFRPNRQYVREMKRFGILPPTFDPAKDPIHIFEADQLYWRSFWHKPASAGGE